MKGLLLTSGVRQTLRAQAARCSWLVALLGATVGPHPASAQTYGDITFFLGSDLHYGYTNGTTTSADLCRATRDRMNVLPGQPYPATTGGGTVDTPRGVLLLGDLTDDAAAANWAALTNDWGLIGERGLGFPVYECFGNHDLFYSSSAVLDGIKARNPLRPGVSNISSNGYHYSWDWDFLHLVCLNLFPGQTPDANGLDPRGSLAFLVDDLARNVGSSDRPVVIYHHYGLDSYAASWWSDQQRTNYLEAITNYNVIAIFAGHNHVVDFIPWCGFNTFNDGTAGKPLFTSYVSFLVAHVTRTNLAILESLPDGTWGAVVNRRITTSDEPCIVANPRSTTVPVGSAATLAVAATGPSLGYQWFFNGTSPIAGATGNALRLDNLRLSQSGAYTVVVTNSLGAAVSQPATVEVSALLEASSVPGLTLSGTVGDSLSLEYADTFDRAAKWQPLGTVTLGNVSQVYADTSSPLPGQRFYRVVSPPAPLGITQVMAITISGEVGDSLRLEYNDTGDPDPATNWLPLAALTLTNASQLYIDGWAPGLARRYRAIAGP